MEFDVKTLFVAFITAIVIGILFWYRNGNFDRIFSLYIFIFGLVLLVLYSVQSGADPYIAGGIATSIIWIGVLILIATVYTLSFAQTNSVWWVLLFSLLILSLILIVLLSRNSVLIQLESPNQAPSWYGFSWIYFIILLLPLLFLSFQRFSWYSVAFLVLLLLSTFFLYWNYEASEVPSRWFYWAWLIVLFFWLLGFIC